MKKVLLACCLVVFTLGTIVGCKPAPSTEKAPAENAAQQQEKEAAPAATAEK